MKLIKIQTKQINSHKLTITPTEVRIKLKHDGVVNEEVLTYLKSVSYKREMLYCDQVWRGQLVERKSKNDGTIEYKIAMKTSGKKRLYFYA